MESTTLQGLQTRTYWRNWSFPNVQFWPLPSLVHILATHRMEPNWRDLKTLLWMGSYHWFHQILITLCLILISQFNGICSFFNSHSLVYRRPFHPPSMVFVKREKPFASRTSSKACTLSLFLPIITINIIINGIIIICWSSWNGAKRLISFGSIVFGYGFWSMVNDHWSK